MAAATGKTRCLICEKEKATSKCAGCLQDFCYTHLGEHRQELFKQLDEIHIHRDLFQQTLNQQTTNPCHHTLIKKIDHWEENSIHIIKELAEETRQTLFIYTNEQRNKTQEKLNELTNQLKLNRKEDDITELNLLKWKEQLQQLTEQLNTLPNILIQQISISLIDKINIQFSELVSIPIINQNAKYIQNGITVAGGNSDGSAINQLCCPYGVYVDDDQTVYVADYWNHRIVEWKKGATTGQIVAGGNGYGNQNNQLNSPPSVIVNKKSDCLIISDHGNQRVVLWPRRNGTSGQTIISNVSCFGLAIDNDEYIYVSDIRKHEVRRWKIGDRNGTLVAGGNGRGNRLDQLNHPNYIFVDQDQSVYVSDLCNHRVMKWMKGAKEGIVVAGGQGQGNGLTQLSNPFGVIVDQLGTVYVADFTNNRILRWLKGTTEGSIVVGGNGEGIQANQWMSPMGLSFDQQNNLYVVDYSNHRIQKFDIEGN